VEGTEEEEAVLCDSRSGKRLVGSDMLVLGRLDTGYMMAIPVGVGRPQNR